LIFWSAPVLLSCNTAICLTTAARPTTRHR